ncbi:hypothetical protein NEDG_00363 [Nematocida displodere]|uniref:Uncharacterized protein n=1 Tax=Nematocida displodere TaxID=1805483 RepID=A0A177EJ43_9MICR|nr:hypothetical protein NEDG_00363 [Nematocida displodere]
MKETVSSSIKKELVNIFTNYIRVTPLAQISEHPFALLSAEFEEVLNQLRFINRSIEEKIAAKTKHITEKQARITELSRLLGKKDKEESSVWIVRDNLAVQEQSLLEEVEELEKEHTQLQERIRANQKEIEYLKKECGEEGGEEEVEHSVSTLALTRASLSRLQEKLARLKEESVQKIDEIHQTLARIGLGDQYAYPALKEVLEAIIMGTYTSLDKPRGQLPTQDQSQDKPRDLPPTHAFSLYEVRDVLECLTRTEVVLAERIDAYQQRHALIKEKVPGYIGTPHSHGTALATMLHLDQEIREIETIYQEKIESIIMENLAKIEVARKELSEIQGVSEDQAVTALPDLSQLSFHQQESFLTKAEAEREALEKESAILKDIKAFIQERKELLEKMSLFEEAASDPRRLFRSSFQLVSEEKFRKMAVPTLLRVEKEIIKLYEDYQALFKKEPLVNGAAIVQDLRLEISSRIINANIFMTGRIGQPNVSKSRISKP